MDKLGGRISPDMAKTLNQMARGVKISVGKQIAKLTGLKMGDLPKKYAKWHLYAATSADLTASHVVSSERLPMEYFSPSPSGVMGGKTSGGVTVNLLGKTVSLKHSFMGQIYSGTTKVWARASTMNKKFKKKNKQQRELPVFDRAIDGKKRYIKSRFPVTPRTFMSVAQLAERPEIKEYLTNSAELEFVKKFDRNLQRLLKEYK